MGRRHLDQHQGLQLLVGTKPSATPERAIELRAPFRGASAPHVLCWARAIYTQLAKSSPDIYDNHDIHMESRLGKSCCICEGLRSTHTFLDSSKLPSWNSNHVGSNPNVPISHHSLLEVLSYLHCSHAVSLANTPSPSRLFDARADVDGHPS
jgi:hypothetical protein